jgi:fatty acid-binding protein DegV
VLNLHKPRDRTHFEQFGSFHRSFYRAVEATSVTPWASRALDRALAAVMVATARHIDRGLTPDAAVKELKKTRTATNTSFFFATARPSRASFASL